MFTEHGSFHVELKGNLLLQEIEGAWNIETSIAYKAAIDDIIKPMIGKPWATMTLMSNWELCTPDSELILVSIIKEAIEHGMVREAVVNDTGIIKLQLFEKYRNDKIHKNAKIPFKRRVFQNEKEALEWLASEGF